MFNFFKKKKETQDTIEKKFEENNFVASVTYYIDADSNTMIDMNIEDYDNATMNGLAHLLTTLSSEQCFLETFEILKTAMMKENEQEALFYLVNQMQTAALKKRSSSIDSQPLIKPSDIIP